MLKAFVGGVSVLDADTMNSLVDLESYRTIYTGASVDSKTGAGATENSVADYNYAVRITATGTTELGYITMTVDGDGTKQDLDIELRDATWSNTGSSDGVLICTRKIPKEFIATTAGSELIPLGISGLTSGANYWLIIKKSGDATNKLDLVGEASQDAAHPVYRRSATTGAWTLNNAIHFNAYNFTPATDADALAVYYGGGITTWMTYDVNGLITLIQYYVPAIDTSAGIRQTFTPVTSGEYTLGGDVV